MVIEFEWTRGRMGLGQHEIVTEATVSTIGDPEANELQYKRADEIYFPI